MLDVLDRIASLDRPQLLVRAARFGVDDWRREAHLPRLLGLPHAPRPVEAIVLLLDAEACAEEARAQGAADYSPARHVALLTALLGEARTLRAARIPALT